MLAAALGTADKLARPLHVQRPQHFMAHSTQAVDCSGVKE